MSALRLDEVAKETVRVRVECCGDRRGACLHWPTAFVRAVRHWQGAFALNRFLQLTNQSAYDLGFKKMGTNGHMHIEWRESPAGAWQALPDSDLIQLRGGRDYRVYDALAGGRNGTGYLYPHRGLPDDISDLVLRRACYRLTDSDEEAKKSSWPEHFVKRVAGIGPPHFRVIHRGGADYMHEINGYYHSHTWLTVQEVENSLRNAGIALDKLADNYTWILKQMRDLEASGKEARLIVWFDSGPMKDRSRRSEIKSGDQ